MLRNRNCCLDLESHRYFFDPDGARIPMRVSVTGVTNHGKDPNRFKGYESAAHRGTHVHRCMEALAKGEKLPDPSALRALTARTGFTSSSTARSAPT